MKDGHTFAIAAILRPLGKCKHNPYPLTVTITITTIITIS
jgi:hypothetical protein